MRKYTKVLFLSLMLLFSSLFFITLNLMRVSAEDVTTLTPEQFGDHLNGYISTATYYSDVDSVIKKYFPDFAITTAQYEGLVTGENHYRILEITPRSFYGDPVTEVSDVMANVKQINQMYRDAIVANNVTGKYFITNMPNFTVDVMTVKQLVDDRQELTGKYDAVVFASGDYNPAQVSSDCDPAVKDCSYILNTKGILNDITPAKAQELISDYVDAGLPVFISSDAVKYAGTNLNTYFGNLDSTHSNVYTVNYTASLLSDNMDFYNALAIMYVTEFTSLKPYINVTNKPADYYTDSSTTYKTGDYINFTVNLTNKNDANLLFYIDINQDEKFAEDELAYAQTIVRGSNSFQYQLPELFSGLLRYKLVVNQDSFNNLYEGVIRIKNAPRTINVLNVVSEMVYNKNSLYDPALYNLYFQNNGDYIINVNSCSVRDFAKNNTRWECSHNAIMDDYDVIMIGQDIFNKPLNTDVYNSLQKQIDNDKPIIFTSSITKGNPKWVSYFGDDLKFSNQSTNLYQLSNNVNMLQIINNSYFVTYPFNMNNEALIVPEDLNYAFNEKYQLDMNNQNLVPLMNMFNSIEYRLDRFDSYNNFYFIKSNNSVYLNVGNNSYKAYKDIEHKLIVNTVVNQFIHYKSQGVKLTDFFYISPDNTYENALIDYKDNINFNFTVFSSKTENYHYVIKVDDRIAQTGDVANNVQINAALSSLITPNQENFARVYVTVNVENSLNETKTYGFYVNVGNFNLYNISFSRTVNATNYQNNQLVEVNKTDKYQYSYALNFRPINADYMDTTDMPKTFVLNNINFSDIIPANVVIDNSMNNITLTTNELGQTVINKVIPEVVYTLVGDQYEPNIKTAYEFTVPFTITAVGNYTLSQAKITFDGIGSDSDNYTFSPSSFRAVKYLDNSMITKNFTDYIFINGTFIDDLRTKFNISNDPYITSVTFTPLNQSDTHFVINGNRIDTVSVGAQDFQINVTDIFGNSVHQTFKVISYKPINSIDFEYLSLIVGDTGTLPITYTTNDPYFTIDNIMVTPMSSSVANIRLGSGNQYVVEALVKGYMDVIVSGYNQDGDLISAAGTILVKEYSDLIFKQDYIKLYIGDTFTYSMMYDNVEFGANVAGMYKYTDISWAVIDPTNSVASITSDGAITALNPGTVLVQGTLPNGAKTILLVKVYNTLSDLSGFNPILNTMKLYAETDYNLASFIKLYPQDINPDNITLTFTITDPSGILEYFDPATNRFRVAKDMEGQLTLQVTIVETRPNGGTTTVVKQQVVNVYKMVDPNVDRGDNKH